MERNKWLDTINGIFQLIINIGILAGFALFFMNLDIVDLYLYNQRCELTRNLPLLQLRNIPGSHFMIIKPAGEFTDGPITNLKITCQCGQESLKDLQPFEGRKIRKSDLIDAIKVCGEKNGAGAEASDTGLVLTFEYTIPNGRIGGRFNRYILENPTIGGGIDEAAIYRDYSNSLFH